MPHFVHSTHRRLAILAAALAGALASPPLFAAESASAPPSPHAQYLIDRANCESGRTTQDRATCLKEAAAAQEERKRNTLDNEGSPRENAVARCKALPARDQADCLARIEGPSGQQRVTTSGSVAGGGILKETTTTVPAASAPGASQPPAR